MIKTKIEALQQILEQAKEKGCSKVKLQLYEDWKEVEKEQKKPSHPVEEYQIDTRFYNTIEFETELKDQVATDKLLTWIDGDTLIVKVTISDRDSLMKGLGIEEFYND